MMSTIIKPPAPISIKSFSVFLGGSIDGDKAVRWQEQLEKMLKHLPITILNPRRDNWDSSWEQKMTNPDFRGQVNWELDGLDLCHCIAMYFDPATKAPITLMELGLHANSSKLIVCCPEGFWRKGNVDIVCSRYGVAEVPSLQKLAKEIIHRYSMYMIVHS